MIFLNRMLSKEMGINLENAEIWSMFPAIIPFLYISLRYLKICLQSLFLLFQIY